MNTAKTSVELGHLQNFYRLSTGLRAMQYDFDYVKTRKLLDPTWNEYDVPEGHDVIEDDVDIKYANLLTSRHRDSDLHRVILDLDNGAKRITPRRLQLPLSVLGAHMYDWSSSHMDSQSAAMTQLLGAENCVTKIIGRHTGGGRHRPELEVIVGCDMALIPSSTPGHYHLILDVNLPWYTYTDLLRQARDIGLIEYGYVDAAIRKGYSSIRTPWTKKSIPQVLNTG